MSNKPVSEQESRKKLFSLAKQLGCEEEFRKIMHRYDDLIKRCSNPVERKQMAVMGNVEIHRLFGFRDGLNIGGVDVIPADPDFKAD